MVEIKDTAELRIRRLSHDPDPAHEVAVAEANRDSTVGLSPEHTWETQDLARDIAAAERAWGMARAMLADPAFDLLVLDELNIALRYEYLSLDAVVAALAARRAGLHVVVTGRNAKPELIAAADLVTEMGAVKHHFAAGVKAQRGIEF